MHYLFIDTCIWLNLAKSKNQYALVETLEHLVESGQVEIVVPDLVKNEFSRNRDRVLESTRQQVGAEFQKIKNIVNAYGGENKSTTISELNDIGSRLPILTEVTGYMADRLTALMESSRQLTVSEGIKLKAVDRALNKLAPFHKSKNSVADAILIELFQNFKSTILDGEFHFITDNYSDFSSKDRREPHSDFSSIFSENAHYHLDIVDAVKNISPDMLEEIELELSWIQEDTRGLNEILDSIEELTDKVWYNRHMYRAHMIEQGQIELIPEGTVRNGNNIIHQHIWDGALVSADRVRQKYDDVGPWDDFEWGMINGKLSALRWLLGDEWDMLDT
ncbi:DUF4935 domain-containing protein [Vibrio alginolyticus]|nr:hypothetical protein [Vibrio alginolyticus]ELB2929753.1 DUF4935 domain-containing protein [Vibrio alginolyticus]